MAAISRGILISRQYSGLLGLQTTRYAGAWNKDWMPGPYPKTEEERLRAARKYGLRPDEYKPVPDDGLGAGDYPDVPLVSAESRNPFTNWDYPEHRRNFGEPLHQNFDIYGLDRINESQEPRFSSTHQFLSFASVMAFFIGTYYFLENRKMHWPLMPKQFPNEGVAHYTFEKPE
ncbi:hypothetical protein Pmani_019131 [Petrolisthes manimaculis]|uniref:NADH dehydrogenase [ubiquinone] 1 beta subcomplex subunit 8, mitochondrial n=1 Tax=Petrolisthes manimaculis TaxID=1843537 RepID=A0AAE1PL07_9EUCA|nr:hypothetical protein Pmani_019131 [Petrolisthes manimaculis]